MTSGKTSRRTLSVAFDAALSAIPADRHWLSSAQLLIIRPDFVKDLDAVLVGLLLVGHQVLIPYPLARSCLRKGTSPFSKRPIRKGCETFSTWAASASSIPTASD